MTTTPTTKRAARITCGSCHQTHASVTEVRDCYDYAEYLDYCEASAESERRGEFAMSWVMGGGRSEDIGAAYLMHVGGAS